MNAPSEIPSTHSDFFVCEELCLMIINRYLGMEYTSPNVTCKAKNQKRGGSIVKGHHKKIR